MIAKTLVYNSLKKDFQVDTKYEIKIKICLIFHS